VKTAATYHRVSRVDQSSALQADETAALVSRRGWTLRPPYADDGISGSHDRRPAFQRMLADARSRRFDVLVVWRTDRLFRSLRELVVTLDELTSFGVDFVSVTEPFDTTTPSGRLLLQMVGAFAEFERSVMIERTHAGIAAARKRGVHCGRPEVELDVARALELRSRGWSFKKIGRELGVSTGKVHAAIASSTPASRNTPAAAELAGAFNNPPLIHRAQVGETTDHPEPVSIVQQPFGC